MLLRYTRVFRCRYTCVINRYKVTHVPSTSLNSNISLTSSTCFFHEQSPPASPFSRAMAEKHGNDRRWRRERWRSPEISPAFPRCASCSVRRSSPAVRAVTAQTRRTRMSRALVSPKRLGSTLMVQRGFVRVTSAAFYRHRCGLIPPFDSRKDTSGVMRRICCYGNEESEGVCMCERQCEGVRARSERGRERGE